jgi:hypothetical protein
MCIYCGTTNYRKIYKNHYGPIPKDETGRTYDIHHIDGNRKNNKPENLKAVTIQEHYDIHYAQGDYGACYRLAIHNMKLSPEELSLLAYNTQKRLVNEGTHHFLGGEVSRSINAERVRNGTHNFLGGDLQRERAKNGTHPFLGGNIQREMNRRTLAAGTHPTQKQWKCEFCGKEGKGASNYTKNHGNKCKFKQ